MNQDSSTDLFASLAGMMIIIVAVLMTAVNVKEQLISIDNRSAPARQVQQSPDTAHLGLLEVAYQEHGNPLFYWKATDHSKKQEFKHYRNLQKTIAGSRPDGIRLRLDNRVPSGVFKRILADTSALNITIYQSDRKE